jgi:hypothetical protein
MTGPQFEVRLYWAHTRGVARAPGVERQLQAPPRIGRQVFDVVDYVPGAVAMVLPKGEGWREMTAREIALARQMLGLPAAVEAAGY